MEAAFDCLSSIDSAHHQDDVDEGEVLEVLQSNEKVRRSGARGKVLKNDDLEYKQREIKNLNKYRDKSQMSNKSDVGAILKGVGDKEDSKNQTDRQMNRHVTLGGRSRGDGSRQRHKDRSSNRHHYSEHKKDRKKRKKSKYGNDSSKSKSKSRFSNNLGLANLNNKDTDGNDGDDIQKLIEEIDNDKNELDQFIS